MVLDKFYHRQKELALLHAHHTIIWNAFLQFRLLKGLYIQKGISPILKKFLKATAGA